LHILLSLKFSVDLGFKFRFSGTQQMKKQLYFTQKIDGYVNSRNMPDRSFRRTPESSKFNTFWMPDQVRHDGFGTFYEFIKINHQICLVKKLSTKKIIF